MKRLLLTAALTVVGLAAAAPVAQAQVFVRAPFVRVWVGPGGGVGVRAPFVNLNVPPGYPPPAYIVPPPPPNFMPPAQFNLPPMPPAVGNVPVPKEAPPAQQPAVAPLTLDQFAKTFQAKAGSYELDLLNPVTKQPTTVRFTLPDGTPKRVIVRQQEIEFVYGIRRFVRIEFDRDGAQVTTR